MRQILRLSIHGAVGPFEWLKVYLDIVAIDSDGKRIHRDDRRQCPYLAGPDVESCAVPRALDLETVHGSLFEGRAVVCANVVQRIKRTGCVNHDHQPIVDLNKQRPRVGDIGRFGNSYEVGHFFEL